MTDVLPKQKTTPRQRVAQLVRLLGTTERGERVNAWNRLEREMQCTGFNWNDVGNGFEYGDGEGEGKYSEQEMLEAIQATRAEAIEEGIKIEQARGNGRGNGHLSLPKPEEMATYCHDRLGQLKDDKQREFVADMLLITRRGTRLSPGRLGYLVSIHIQNGGRT